MDIDLSQAIVYKVKLPNDVMVELREPTNNDLDILSNSENQTPKEQNENFTKFVVALGMPKEHLDKLGVVTIKKLADGLMEPLKEKK